MNLGLFHSPPWNPISRREYPLDSLLSRRVHRQMVCVVRTAMCRYAVRSAGAQAFTASNQVLARYCESKVVFEVSGVGRIMKLCGNRGTGLEGI